MIGGMTSHSTAKAIIKALKLTTKEVVVLDGVDQPTSVNSTEVCTDGNTKVYTKRKHHPIMITGQSHLSHKQIKGLQKLIPKGE